MTEALKARDAAKAKGINIGIILLEKIKPYEECAKNIAKLLPKSTKKLLFLEEEMRAGGMGMMLRDEMLRKGLLHCETEILAIDDNFVPRHCGCTVYEDAGISAEHILKTFGIA